MTQTKISNKQMRWVNFLSQFNLHMAHIARNDNSVTDALSRRPMVNAITIAHHNDLMTMIDDYVTNEDYASEPENGCTASSLMCTHPLGHSMGIEWGHHLVLTATRSLFMNV